MWRARPLPLLVAAMLCVIVVASCSSGGPDPKATPRTTTPSTPGPSISELPRCKRPKSLSDPKWLPRDLPLPDGTYASQRLPTTVGYSRGLFVLPMGTSDFARFVLKEWPEAGWQLGRGDAEPGEVEDQFIKSPAFGAFKAQDMICSPPHSIMLLIYVPDRSKLPGVSASPLPNRSPSASGSPLAPSPSPSPS